MIYLDVTKLAQARQKSGLTRVGARLRSEFGAQVVPVTWDRGFREVAAGTAPRFTPADWVFTPELFSEAERPGFTEFIRRRGVRLAALFHDAIPLRLPHVTWAHSVERHPGYLKLLAEFDLVLPISRDAARDLTGFWRWQGAAVRAVVVPVELGADFDGSPRVTSVPPAPARPACLAVGIIEPRKNQGFLLEVAEALWRDGVDFDLHLVGRVNPQHGRPIADRLRAAARREPRLHLHGPAGDTVLAQLYAEASAVVFPTLAEGCGLPLLEALWRGVPVVASDLPVLRESAAGGGCVLAPVGDVGAWGRALRDVLKAPGKRAGLVQAAVTRPLPTWADTARSILAALARPPAGVTAA